MKRLKRALAFVITFVLVIGMVPGISAKAADEFSMYIDVKNKMHVAVLENNSTLELMFEVDEDSTGAKIVEKTEVGPNETVSKEFGITIEGTMRAYWWNDTRGEWVFLDSEKIEGQHYYSVDYYYNGEVIATAGAGMVKFGSSATVPLDSEFATDDGKEWQLVDKTQPVMVVPYGTEQAIVEVEPYEDEPEEYGVYFIDRNNNTIKSVMDESKDKIPFDKGNGYVEVEIPESFTTDDGKEYVLVDEGIKPGKLKINYYDEVKFYDIAYDLVEQEEKGPYKVDVILKSADADGNPLIQIGYNFFNTDTEATDDVEFIPDKEVRVRNLAEGTTTVYELIGPDKITHNPDSDLRSYEILYKEVNKLEAYDWIIQLKDTSGNIIKVVREPIAIGETKPYEAEMTFDDHGKSYILDEKAPKLYSHTHGDDQVTDIYYHEADVDYPSSYDIQVQYMNITDNEILKEAEPITVLASEGGVDIVSPENYEADGREFVRLNGQKDIRRHNYYSKQRTFTIYYRDVNDVHNANAVVTIEDPLLDPVVIQDPDTVDTEVDTVVAGGDTGADVTAPAVDEGASGVNTLITNEDTGETVVFNDEAVPQADSVGESVTNTDDQVPKAKAQVASVTSSLPFIIGVSAAGLAILLLILLFFYKRKKEGHIGTDNK